MKPTCDLCPRLATRWYVPGDDARCGLHERSESASVPLTRRPPPSTATLPLLTRDELARLPKASIVEKVLGLRGDVEEDAEELRALRAQVATVRPPADERCPRCSRILIAAPCGCVSAAQRWVMLQQEADALWRAMSSAERVDAVRLKAAAKGAPARSFDIHTTHEGISQ